MHLKPALRLGGWGDNKTRSLGEAARLAHALADAEALPIGKTLAREGHGAGTDGWYAESILHTVPVYGTSTAAPERLDAAALAGLHLSEGAETLDGDAAPVWRNLQVKREDFARYVEWLRSVW
ncbi:MAG TPA: hypothetical protein VGC27_06475 [Rhizomicrobium sp.]